MELLCSAVQYRLERHGSAPRKLSNLWAALLLFILSHRPSNDKVKMLSGAYGAL